MVRDPNKSFHILLGRSGKASKVGCAAPAHARPDGADSGRPGSKRQRMGYRLGLLLPGLLLGGLLLLGRPHQVCIPWVAFYCLAFHCLCRLAFRGLVPHTSVSKLSPTGPEGCGKLSWGPASCVAPSGEEEITDIQFDHIHIVFCFWDGIQMLALFRNGIPVQHLSAFSHVYFLPPCEGTNLYLSFGFSGQLPGATYSSPRFVLDFAMFPFPVFSHSGM